VQTDRVTDRQIVEAMVREAAIHARNLALLAHPEFVEATLAGLEQERRGQAIPLDEALRQLDPS
jgi:hypothetical protein